jgi:hypothetical protein
MEQKRTLSRLAELAIRIRRCCPQRSALVLALTAAATGHPLLTLGSIATSGPLAVARLIAPPETPGRGTSRKVAGAARAAESRRDLRNSRYYWKLLRKAETPPGVGGGSGALLESGHKQPRQRSPDTPGKANASLDPRVGANLLFATSGPRG